jgi:hypothetical protein
MQSKTISLDVKAVEKIIGDLTFMLTSMDRLGSAQLAKEVEMQWMHSFLRDGDVFRKLAKIRGIISIALEDVFTEEEDEAMNERLEKIKPWPLP